jgi:GT2 family glycosyltransferase
VIVVDDGSLDSTAEELRGLEHARLHVLRNERPEGVAAARNHGLAHVSAPWVAFLDDDDVWAPGFLAAMLGALRIAESDREEAGLVYSGHLTVDSERRVTGVSPAPPPEIARSGMDRFNFIGCPSRVLARTEAVRGAGGFDVRLAIVADWDLWLRMMAKCAVVRCPEVLVGYMRHPGNMHLDADRFLEELAFMQRKHGWHTRRPLAGDMLPSFVAEAYRASGRRVRAARWYLRAFRVQRTRRDLARAVGVLLGERIIELSGLREQTVVDPSLCGWLDRVREAERATTTGLPAVAAVRHDHAWRP